MKHCTICNEDRIARGLGYLSLRRCGENTYVYVSRRRYWQQRKLPFRDVGGFFEARESSQRHRGVSLRFRIVGRL